MFTELRKGANHPLMLLNYFKGGGKLEEVVTVLHRTGYFGPQATRDMVSTRGRMLGFVCVSVGFRRVVSEQAIKTCSTEAIWQRCPVIKFFLFFSSLSFHFVLFCCTLSFFTSLLCSTFLFSPLSLSECSHFVHDRYLGYPHRVDNDHGRIMRDQPKGDKLMNEWNLFFSLWRGRGAGGGESLYVMCCWCGVSYREI